MRQINELIIHCTATPDGKDYSAADIRKWHMQGNGWADIGYHYIVRLDGKVENGRPIDRIGAHCIGHNANSIGICYVGGLASDGKTPKDTRTAAQKESLLRLLKELKKKYPKASIRSHRDFALKACPSFNATQEYKNL